MQYGAVHNALHSAADSVAHALALVGGPRETGIILEGFQCLLILGRGPAKGVALEQLILDAFLNGFVMKSLALGRELFLENRRRRRASLMCIYNTTQCTVHSTVQLTV